LSEVEAAIASGIGWEEMSDDLRAAAMEFGFGPDGKRAREDALAREQEGERAESTRRVVDSPESPPLRRMPTLLLEKVPRGAQRSAPAARAKGSGGAAGALVAMAIRDARTSVLATHEGPPGPPARRSAPATILGGAPPLCATVAAQIERAGEPSAPELEAAAKRAAEREGGEAKRESGEGSEAGGRLFSAPVCHDCRRALSPGEIADGRGTRWCPRCMAKPLCDNCVDPHWDLPTCPRPREVSRSPRGHQGPRPQAPGYPFPARHQHIRHPFSDECEECIEEEERQTPAEADGAAQGEDGDWDQHLFAGPPWEPPRDEGNPHCPQGP
jgi:hypothetical protein